MATTTAAADLAAYAAKVETEAARLPDDLRALVTAVCAAARDAAPLLDAAPTASTERAVRASLADARATIRDYLTLPVAFRLNQTVVGGATPHTRLRDDLKALQAGLDAIVEAAAVARATTLAARGARMNQLGEPPRPTTTVTFTRPATITEDLMLRYAIPATYRRPALVAGAAVAAVAVFALASCQGGDTATAAVPSGPTPTVTVTASPRTPAAAPTAWAWATDTSTPTPTATTVPDVSRGPRAHPTGTGGRPLTAPERIRAFLEGSHS